MEGHIMKCMFKQKVSIRFETGLKFLTKLRQFNFNFIK